MSAAPNVTVFSTVTCAYCHAEKAFLKEHNIAFKDIYVDSDEDAARAMIQRSGQMGVPFTVIEDAEGNSIDEIVGFDQARLEKALAL